MILELVESPDEVIRSSDAFHREIPSDPDPARLLVRKSWYFVYDPARRRFTPSKWAGFRGMDSGLYGAGIDGATDGAAFNGTRARVAVERALGTRFRPDPVLDAALASWARETFGGDVLDGVDTRKWKYVRLPEHADASREAGPYSPGADPSDISHGPAWVEISVPRSIMYRVERTASATGDGVRTVVSRALEDWLDRWEAENRFRLRDVSFGGDGLNPEFDDGDWGRMREAAYEGQGG